MDSPLRRESFLCLREARRHKEKKKPCRPRRQRLASAAKALLVVGGGNLQRDRPDYGSEMRRARLATGIPPSFCLPRRLNKARGTSLGGMKGSICLLLSSRGEWNGFGWKTSRGGAAGAVKHLRQSRLGEQIHATPPCRYKEGAKQSCKSKWTLPLPAQSLCWQNIGGFFFILFCPFIYSLILFIFLHAGCLFSFRETLLRN